MQAQPLCRHWVTTMDTWVTGCQRTCYRRNVITSGRIPISVLMTHQDRFFILNGWTIKLTYKLIACFIRLLTLPGFINRETASPEYTPIFSVKTKAQRGWDIKELWQVKCLNITVYFWLEVLKNNARLHLISILQQSNIKIHLWNSPILAQG